mgnify:CR=1 FL=1
MLTAIATYALLASGENPNDPRIKQAVAFLMEADIVGIYALGMRAQVWTYLRQDAAVLRAMRKDAQLIRQGIKAGGEMSGFFDYTYNDTDKRYDHSVSQYAVLGLWALADQMQGFNWDLMRRAWQGHQHPNGGWGYRGPDKPTASMTAAGVASLFIIQEMLNKGGGAECRGNLFDEHIDRGLQWMNDNFEHVDGRRSYYTLYGSNGSAWRRATSISDG